MTDFRALCVELLSWADKTSAHYYVQPEVLERVRAALAESDGPAVSDDREPASVATQPSDEEIIEFWSDHCAGDGDAGIIRLARFGRPAPTPPADREVMGPTYDDLAELCSKHGLDADSWSLERFDALWEVSRSVLSRYGRPAPAPAGERQVGPVPVASNVYFEFVVSDADYCTQTGGIAPSYAQALSEGHHYLAQYQQDGPHTLEVRRVEVLPLPSGEVE